MSLVTETCAPCRQGAEPLPDDQIAELLYELPGWRVTRDDGPLRLTRSFDVRPYRGALAFVNQIAELAETEGHHPELTLRWGEVAVSWWTHVVNGLHRNDFILAARTDQLAATFVTERKGDRPV